jgi:hypothetical protein
MRVSEKKIRVAVDVRSAWVFGDHVAKICGEDCILKIARQDVRSGSAAVKNAHVYALGIMKWISVFIAATVSSRFHCVVTATAY